MDGLAKLKTGDFNDMTQDWQGDGSVIITLSKRGEGKVYTIHVINLYQEDEEVLVEYVTEVG